MFKKKVYGESRNDSCWFCPKQATTENADGLPACIDHKANESPTLKCACGQYVDIKKSKWGVFFLCQSCGPLSRSKMTNIMDQTSESGFKLNKKFREAAKPVQMPTKTVNKLPSMMTAYEKYLASAKEKAMLKVHESQKVEQTKEEKIISMDELVKQWQEESAGDKPKGDK